MLDTFLLSTARTRRLGPPDTPELQRLFERCSDFFELIEGAATRSNAAVEELASLAPGKTAEETFCFGAFVEDRLIAFANLTRDYPKTGEWWLGLLLIDPSERNRGFGAEWHGTIAEWVSAQSGSALSLVVQAQNEAAHRFWLRQGYIERNRQPFVAPTGFESIAILMSFSLSGLHARQPQA
jgi:GNAT superfamily N-acetyltransferase